MIISIIICSVIGYLFSLLYKNKEKKDKGFAFVYYGLSYRRKMIRMLWMLSIVLLLLIVFSVRIEMTSTGKGIVWISLLILFSAQLFYNYYKWKKEEQGVEAG